MSMSSTQKTEAQRLADAVEVGGRPGGNRHLAAAELRRLDAENQQLRAQLDQAVASRSELLEALEAIIESVDAGSCAMLTHLQWVARAAIAKATGVAQ